MKKTLSTILLGASLFFGAGNKTKAQECVKYNHDNDEFSEEIVGHKLEEVDKKSRWQGLTIIYYSDKDNDNFHESIRTFNCNGIPMGKIVLSIEDFYINKNTGLMDYSFKEYITFKNKLMEYYANKSFIEIIKENVPKENLRFACTYKINYSGLTKEQIYSLFPGNWTFYGGFGERVKKLINAGKDEVELKNMVNNERYLWGENYK